MDDFETDFDFENFDIEAFAREAIGDIQPIESAMTQPQRYVTLNTYLFISTGH